MQFSEDEKKKVCYLDTLAEEECVGTRAPYYNKRLSEADVDFFILDR